MPKKSALMIPREHEICARVKQFREQIKWPQSGFSKELGITRDQLASIEYGRTPLRYDIGFRLCYMFDVNQEWLASGNGLVTPFTALSEFPFPDSLPNKMLFSVAHAALAKTSDIYSSVVKSSKKGPSPPVLEQQKLLPGFNPVAHLVKQISEILTSENFRTELEKQQFALEASMALGTLAFRLRRKSLKKEIRKAGSIRTFSRKADKDLTRLDSNQAAAILKLEDKIKWIQADIARLESGED